MVIRRIKESDYKAVADMIARSVSSPSYAKFYPQSSIEKVIHALDENGVKKRASWTHFYIIEEESEIVACGAIGPYWDSLTESSLFSIFVDDKCQGKGYGKKIIETLEEDEFFVRADRIEIPAAISAIPFYRKMGYEHKNGVLTYSDEHVCLEKFNKK
ncbi:MAG: GNAT family N-acetyltransferase [Clostridiales bacterium]|nr:GNAT family N-acetyltransferase [Clostridiales bacterium]